MKSHEPTNPLGYRSNVPRAKKLSKRHGVVGEVSSVAAVPASRSANPQLLAKCVDSEEIDIVESLMKELIEQNLEESTAGERTQERLVTAEEALSRLQTIIESTWADSTLKSRRNLWVRLHKWTAARNLPVNPNTAALWITATACPEAEKASKDSAKKTKRKGTNVAGQLSYARALSGIFRALGVDPRPLNLLARALVGLGGTIPSNQATPIPKDAIPHLLQTFRSREMRAAIILCWKAASRWGEVRSLRAENILYVSDSPAEVIVDWMGLPKGRRHSPFKSSRYVVILGDGALSLTTYFREIGWMGMFQYRGHRFVPNPRPYTGPPDRADMPMTGTSTKQATNAMKSFSWEGVRFTAHSLKRGAIGEITRIAAENPQQFSTLEWLRLIKHSTPMDDVPPVTIRYAPAPELARYLGTGKVTQLL